MTASTVILQSFIVTLFAVFSKAVPYNVLCEDPQGQYYWGPPGCDATIIPTQQPTHVVCESPDGQIYWSPSDCTESPRQNSQSLTTNPRTLTSIVSAETASYGCQGLSSTTYATGWLTSNLCIPTSTSSAGSFATSCVATSYSTSVSRDKMALSSLSDFASATLGPSSISASSLVIHTHASSSSSLFPPSNETGQPNRTTLATALVSSSSITGGLSTSQSSYSASSPQAVLKATSTTSSFISSSTFVASLSSAPSSIPWRPPNLQTTNSPSSVMLGPSGWTSRRGTATSVSPTTPSLYSASGYVMLPSSSGPFISLNSQSLLSTNSSPSSGSNPLNQSPASSPGYLYSTYLSLSSGESLPSSSQSSSNGQRFTSYPAFSSSRILSPASSPSQLVSSQSFFSIPNSARNLVSSLSKPSGPKSGPSTPASLQLSSAMGNKSTTSGDSSPGLFTKPSSSISNANLVSSASSSSSSTSLSAPSVLSSGSSLNSLPSIAKTFSTTSVLTAMTSIYSSTSDKSDKTASSGGTSMITSSASVALSASITDGFVKSTGNASSVASSIPSTTTPTLSCTADANTASLVPISGVKADPTVCSCDNGQYYSTLSISASICAYTASNPYALSPPDAGPWTFARLDLEPSICTATVFPVSTTNLMPTGEFVVEADWSGSNTWLFSADTGMNLSSLGYGEFSTSPFTRNANGSYTFSVPTQGGDQSVTGLASGTPANATEACAHEFALTVSTTLACDVPLPVSCQANDDELDASQWDAFRTDDWWTAYVANYTAEGSEMTLFEELVYDYIGPPDEYYCTIGDTSLNGDGSMDVGSCTYPICVSVNTTLSSIDGFRQGYMVLADWEGLSHFLNYCWGVLDQAQNGFDDVISAIYEKFYRDPALASWQTLLPVVGTVFTLACVVLLFINPFFGGAALATAANFVYAIGASLNGIANIKNLNVPSTVVLEWDGATNTQNDWRNYMSAMKSGLSNLHDSYFLNAYDTAPVNITTLIQGGAYLPEEATVSQTSVIPSDNVTAWLEAYACARLINQLFVNNGYYIVYIPYGSYVEDVQGAYSRGNFSFEKSDCEQWVGNPNWNKWVYATCDTVDAINPGMTVMEGVQDAFLDITTYNFKAGFTQNFTDGNFTYNPEDVIQSSVAGWLDYGYNYTLLNQNFGLSPDALDSVEDFKEQLFAVANIKPSNEGVYSLPVCVLNDLASMPECEYALPENDNDGDKTPLSWDQTDQCYIHPNNCLGDQSGVLPKENATYGFQYFRDYIDDSLKSSLNSVVQAGPDSAPKKRHLGDSKVVDVGTRKLQREHQIPRRRW